MAQNGGDVTPRMSSAGVGGLFGVTPSASPAATPVPGGGVPDGRSPNAKRPLNRDTIAMAVSEVRPMSQDDMVSGLHTLHANQERDRKWT